MCGVMPMISPARYVPPMPRKPAPTVLTVVIALLDSVTTAALPAGMFTLEVVPARVTMRSGSWPAGSVQSAILVRSALGDSPIGMN